METNWVVELVRGVGVPVALLFFIGLGSWRVATWAGRELILPMRDKLLDRAVSVLDQMSVALLDMNVSIRRITRQIQRMERAYALRRAEAALHAPTHGAIPPSSTPFTPPSPPSPPRGPSITDFTRDPP